MNALADRTHVERFRAAIAQRMGLYFDDAKVDHLAEILRVRISRTGSDCADSYLALLRSSDGREEWYALAEELTVTETYFFRYWDHFRAFQEIVLPDCVRSQGMRRELRILSAGCASGEEAYSLAILARERLQELMGSSLVKIMAIDVNRSMIQKALRGRYSAWSLRETPTDLRNRYFKTDGRDFVLDDEIRAMVTFQERNILDADPVFWQPGSFDIVFCRNVVMYFTPEVMRAVIDRMARALRPGGYLFLGHAETLRGVSDEFHLRHTHGAFYYQSKDSHESPPFPTRWTSLPSLQPSASHAPVPIDSSTSWVDTIRQASERIAVLAGGGPPTSLEPASPSVASESCTRTASGTTSDLGTALELMRRERFGEAMEFLRNLSPQSGKEPEVLLLHAILLTNSGDITRAEETCRELLACDELNAGAHYVMALCREHAGNRQASIEQDQTAIYLDPDFAMPHLHLGILARKEGDFDSARRELRQALALFAKEDPSRILFFGGGFGREALIALCQGELRACGGHP